MNDQAPAATADELLPESETANSAPSFWLHFEQTLDRLGDWLNPILVKETRQALKSKQFSITFSLLLLLGWLWTALFVILTVPTVYYVPLGPYVLGGYCLVLTIPLLIVVPYAAFRSLAAELEDGTFEILSITSLGARQIVLGKLGSSVVQMIVYYSALAPCVAFTYLLRGLDLLTIIHILGFTFLGSLMLSILGLMLATVTRSRHWQMVLSVLLVMILLGCAFFGNMFLMSIVSRPQDFLYFDRWEFWTTEATFMTFYSLYALLFLQIAAGQISFASENRATPIRWYLFAIQLAIIGWSFYLMVAHEMPPIGMVILSTLHWISAGIFLTGEHSQLSPRALRSLPQSLSGRMFLTWFNPGAKTGYLFAMTCLLSTLLMALGYVVFAPSYLVDNDPFNIERWHTMLCLVGYTCFYLGFTRLFVAGFARLGRTATMLVQAILQLLVAFMACLLPVVLQMSLDVRFRRGQMEYTLLQLPNWMWTLIEAGEGNLALNQTSGINSKTSLGSLEISVPWVVFALGLAMYLLHVWLAAGETEKKRLAVPQRVRDEDTALGRSQRPAMIEI